MSIKTYVPLPNLVLTEELRDAIEAEREETGLSMNEIIRTILCGHYSLLCEQVDSFGGKQPGGEKFTLRVSPELFRALQREKKKTGIPMARLVRDILAEHYALAVT